MFAAIIDRIFKNWKSTLAGIFGLLGVGLLAASGEVDVQGGGVKDWMAFVSVVGAAIWNAASKDPAKT